MKKITSILVSLLMLISISIPAFATGEVKIIINNEPEKTGVTMVGNTYNAYKVFDVNILQGQDGKNKYEYTVAEKFEEFFIGKKGETNPNQNLNEFAVAYMNSTDKTIDEIGKELSEYVNNPDNKITTDGTSGEITVVNEVEKTEITGLATGYYIVLGQSKVASEDPEEQKKVVVVAAALGTTNTDLEINLKASAPTIDKEVKEGNDWGDGSGAQIGDLVEYRLTATLPTSVTGYNQYIYRIHDKLSEGLTFNPGSLKVYVGDRELTTNYYGLTSPAADGHTFDLTVDVLNGQGKEDGFALGDKLYIYYNATLNENALIVGGANKNDVNLEYSSNPYDENTTNKTPEIIVNSYTFKISALKVDELDNTLQGAEFQLSKKVKDENNNDVDRIINFDITSLTDGTNVYKVCTHAANAENCTKTPNIVSGSNGKFDIVGLDDNEEYTLTETKSPDGYNKIVPIKFTIKSIYDKNGDITSITVTHTITDSTDGSMTVDEHFNISTTIVNKSKGLLPDTGGIGTTLFAVVGGSLMMFAVGVLIVKKRKKA